MFPVEDADAVDVIVPVTEGDADQLGVVPPINTVPVAPTASLAGVELLDA
jgi:hypothetical protein